MSKPPKPKYCTTNWSAYNESLRQRGSMLLWIDRDMNREGTQSGKRGHLPQFSDAAIQFCLMIKNLYGLALRQSTGMVQSLLKLAGHNWEVPDYSTLCRRQKILQVTLTHQSIITATSNSIGKSMRQVCFPPCVVVPIVAALRTRIRIFALGTMYAREKNSSQENGDLNGHGSEIPSTQQ